MINKNKNLIFILLLLLNTKTIQAEYAGLPTALLAAASLVGSGTLGYYIGHRNTKETERIANIQTLHREIKSRYEHPQPQKDLDQLKVYTEKLSQDIGELRNATYHLEEKTDLHQEIQKTVTSLEGYETTIHTLYACMFIETLKAKYPGILTGNYNAHDIQTAALKNYGAEEYPFTAYKSAVAGDLEECKRISLGTPSDSVSQIQPFTKRLERLNQETNLHLYELLTKEREKRKTEDQKQTLLNAELTTHTSLQECAHSIERKTQTFVTEAQQRLDFIREIQYTIRNLLQTLREDQKKLHRLLTQLSQENKAFSKSRKQLEEASRNRKALETMLVDHDRKLNLLVTLLQQKNEPNVQLQEKDTSFTENPVNGKNNLEPSS